MCHRATVTHRSVEKLMFSHIFFYQTLEECYENQNASYLLKNPRKSRGLGLESDQRWDSLNPNKGASTGYLARQQSSSVIISKVLGICFKSMCKYFNLN